MRKATIFTIAGDLFRPGSGLGRGWTFWLGLFGVSAAITMLVPSIVSVALISIIGMPIAFFLLIAPFLFLLSLGTWLISSRLGGGLLAIGAGAAITLGLLAVPPLLANRMLAGNAQALVAGDRDDGTRPAGTTVAVRYDRLAQGGKDIVNCDGFCQRALLNGVAKRVLFFEQDLNLAIDPAMTVDSFRLERRANCPAVNLPSGADPIEIAGEKRDRKAKRADELMRIEIAKGRCLIAERTPLSSADLVLSVGNAHRGASPLGAGLSLFADTVRADRIAMHEKRDGVFAETYRKTFVVMHKLLPFYAPTADGGQELRMYVVLARKRETINISEKHYGKPDWTGFLLDRLGYDLALRNGDAEAQTRQVLKDALLRPSDSEKLPTAVATDFFSSLRGQRGIPNADVDLARRLLTDERIPITNAAAGAMAHTKSASAAFYDAVATSMFARLRRMATSNTGAKHPPWAAEARYIGSILAELPRETILKNRDSLAWLARQERVRAEAWRALSRFGEFGPEGIAPLLRLIDESHRQRKDKGDAWQSPHLAGLLGLCRMGEAGREAIAPLYRRLESGVLATSGSYRRLVIHMFIGMGADPDELWRRMRAAGGSAAKDETKARSTFDGEARRAQKRVQCYY